MDIKFTKFTHGENWVSGQVGDNFEFSSKLYDSGSEYGINGGRVSKLAIRDLNRGDNGGWFDTHIVNYDRGWDIHPKTLEEEEIYQTVLNFLENAPKTRFGTGE